MCSSSSALKIDLLPDGRELWKYRDYTQVIKNSLFELPKALAAFNELKDKGFEPDVACYVSVLKACARNRDSTTALSIFEEMITSGNRQIGASECGAVLSSFERKRDWNGALLFLERIKALGVSWDSWMYATAINVCAKVIFVASCKLCHPFNRAKSR
jgi:pentatricopeptide repeat protein